MLGRHQEAGARDPLHCVALRLGATEAMILDPTESCALPVCAANWIRCSGADSEQHVTLAALVFVVRDSKRSK